MANKVSVLPVQPCPLIALALWCSNEPCSRAWRTACACMGFRPWYVMSTRQRIIVLDRCDELQIVQRVIQPRTPVELQHHCWGPHGFSGVRRQSTLKSLPWLCFTTICCSMNIVGLLSEAQRGTSCAPKIAEVGTSQAPASPEYGHPPPTPLLAPAGERGTSCMPPPPSRPP